MPDFITFNCPNCSTQLDVPAELAGVSGPCPSCGVSITAPTASTEPTAPEDTPLITKPSSQPARTKAPSDVREVPSPSTEPKLSTQAPLQPESAGPSASRSTGSWRQPVKNGLIGFISVFALAAATWGVAKAIEKSKKKDTSEIAAPIERIAPKASPMKINDDTSPNLTITKGGNVIEGNSVFPIVNTIEPPNINFTSTPDSLVTPNSTINQNRDELNDLIGNTSTPASPQKAPQSETEKMLIESRKLIDDFIAAETLEERLPMIFSERVPAAEMSEYFADTLLNTPIELSKTVSRSPVIHFAHEGPNAEGIIQLYYYAALAASKDGSEPPRNIVFHMANHHEGKFRINADAFLFCAENKLEKFIDNPQAEPLIAYLFLERCHYKAGAVKSPSGTFSVRLLTDPFDQSANTALVDTMRTPGEILNPLVKWGVPSRAAIIELKHDSNTLDEDNISIDRVLKLNWLQSYNATANDDK